MIDNAKLNKLLELISELVGHGEGSWKDKKNSLLAVADEREKGDLEEFCAWFE